jgi:hypothetical protein
MNAILDVADATAKLSRAGAASAPLSERAVRSKVVKTTTATNALAAATVP